MRTALALLLSIATASSASAGSYFLSADPGVDPFVVVHAPGYTGAGGTLTVEVCRTPTSSLLEGSLIQAIAIWDAVAPTQANCSGECVVVEEKPLPDLDLLDGVSGIVHELGHCLGLGHANWDDFPLTSFTNTKDATSIDDGLDNRRGSRDDIPSPLPGSRVLHWFRISDNNPVVIDGTVIDSATFNRAISLLPQGDRWPASANLLVSGDLGAPNTQTVMMTRLRRGAAIQNLAPDDVNTVRFARTGLDELAGTADDYTVDVVFVVNCASAEILVDLVQMAAGDAGACLGDIELVPFPGGPPNHFRVTGGGNPILLQINRGARWDFLNVLLAGFETGDTSEWSVTFP